MRLPLSLLLLLGLPGAAVAEEQCKFSDPRSLELQLSGIKTVLFEIASTTCAWRRSRAPAGA